MTGSTQQHQDHGFLFVGAGTNSIRSKPDIRHLLDRMSLEDKIGQMAQIDVAMLMKTVPRPGGGKDETVKELDIEAVKKWIGEAGVGSVLNFAEPTWTATQYRQAAALIQEVARTYNRPPVIWGLDSVHGANYIIGATLPPQPINMAATFNLTNSYLAGVMASRDTRAAGINWLFSPLLEVVMEPRWARVYETFGEDPAVVGLMASEMIRGIQEIDTDSAAIPSRAAACAKHFIGYSYPKNGHDRSPSWIPTRHLYQYFVPVWQRVFNSDSSPLTIMESYTETDGVPIVANSHALNYLLRQRLRFNGVMVTDYEEMRNLHNWHKITPNVTTAIQTSLREGSVDMSMVPWDTNEFRQSIVEGIDNHILHADRIDVSAERVLKLKETLNMFDEHLMPDPDLNLNQIGSDHSVGLDMARESIILAKNNGLLPFAPSAKTSRRSKVLVTGPTANSLILQTGGWTGLWQGAPNEEYFTYGSTIFGAFSSETNLEVSYSCGVDVIGDECQDSDNSKGTVVQQLASWAGLGSGDTSTARAVTAAQQSDVVVVCVGEESHAEKPGDIRSLDLPEAQYNLVRSLRKETDAKIVLVYFGGRPRLLKDMVDNADAVLIGFLPGPSAGEAIVDIVTGRVNPSGRMPITYPMYDDGGGIPYFHAVSDKCNKGTGALPHFEYDYCEVQFPFGHGLSYTTFAYSDLVASGGIDADLEVSVMVKNTGEVAGSEAVLFFTFDDFRSTTPEYKRLRAFDKVFLEPGQEMVVRQTVPLDELRFVGPHDDRHYIIDPTMTSAVGVGANTDCRLDPDSVLCHRLQANAPEQRYVGACEAACDLWMSSGCTASYGFSSSKTCIDMCVSISEYPNSAMHQGNDGWGWGYVNCLESVVWGFEQKGGKHECWKMTGLCRNIFQTGMLDEYGSGNSGGIAPNMNPLQSFPASNLVALIVGLFASALIMSVMNGSALSWRRKIGRGGDVQFTPVPNQEANDNTIG